MTHKFLTAQKAIKILGISDSTFYRFVHEGKITRIFPTTESKHAIYDPKQIARLKSQLKQEEEPPQRGSTDWIKPHDIGIIYNLEYPVYGEATGNPSTIRKWYAQNPYICRVMFNEQDRRDIWGCINLLPLEEHTILQILQGEIRDVDLNPERDIQKYDHKGTFHLYVASIIMRDDKRYQFSKLMNSVFAFWCDEQAPAGRFIGKIYGHVIGLDGELIARRFFFSPIWHVADSAYVLDLSRPNPSKIIKSFQFCIESRRQEATD